MRNRPTRPADAPAPADPQDALAAALADAAGLLAARRPAEATATLKAAEALARLAGVTPGSAVATPDPNEEARRIYLAQHAEWAEIWRKAELLAENLLADRPIGIIGAYSWHIHRWRAMRLGPETAAADHARALENGTADRDWLVDGTLRARPSSDLLLYDSEPEIADLHESQGFQAIGPRVSDSVERGGRAAA